MSKQIQITLVSDKGYRPVSTLITVDKVSDYVENKTKWQTLAVQRICGKRHWSASDLKKYGYTGLKARVYDKEKIEAENAARYEKIKEERGWK